MLILDEIVERDCIEAVPSYEFVTDCNTGEALFRFTNDGDELARMAAASPVDHFLPGRYAPLDVPAHSSVNWRTDLEVGESREFMVSADWEPLFVGTFAFDCTPPEPAPVESAAEPLTDADSQAEVDATVGTDEEIDEASPSDAVVTSPAVEAEPVDDGPVEPEGQSVAVTEEAAAPDTNPTGTESGGSGALTWIALLLVALVAGGAGAAGVVAAQKVR
ncbi:MAG: hypothetical protein OEU32_17885 [Acidimicrobiia bacterium]|nr:hypothetical protein [Acidimicrobiia bacterium]